MRTAVRLLVTAATAATVGSTAGLSGLALGAAAFNQAVPTRASTTMTTATTSTRDVGPSYELPGGLALPHGATALSPGTASTDARGMTRWEARLDLGDTTGAAALDLLADQLANAHWQVTRGSKDLFAARLTDGRWEIVVARWPAPRTDSAHSLGIGIGSRPA
jgi:hypothetical protein